MVIYLKYRFHFLLSRGIAILRVAATLFRWYVDWKYRNELIRTLFLIYIGSGFADESATRLSNPTNMKFDRHHNIYVVDTPNSRIQRFDLLDNGC